VFFSHSGGGLWGLLDLAGGVTKGAISEDEKKKKKSRRKSEKDKQNGLRKNLRLVTQNVSKE